MASPLSQFRSYFRFRKGEEPREADLNAGLVDKIDIDMNQALNQAVANATALDTLKGRVDVSLDEDGNLIGTPPEFTDFTFSTPSFSSATQFYVSGNYTNIFTVGRSVKAVINGSQPVSDIQAVAYDGGSDRTNVTLYDSILDGTLSAVKVGFIQYSLPRVGTADLNFVPALLSELTDHATETADPADHDAIYPRKDLTSLQTFNGAIRTSKASSTTIEAEDRDGTVSQYRIGRLRQVVQVLNLEVMRPDNSALKTFLALDGANDKMTAGYKLDMNSKVLTGLAAPSASSDAARKADIDAVKVNRDTTKLFMRDDFLRSGGGLYGELNWGVGAQYLNVTGSGIGAPVAEHPGVIAFTGTYDTQAGVMYLILTYLPYPFHQSEDFDLSFIIKPAYDNSTNVKYRFGLYEAAQNPYIDPPNSGVYFEKLTGDTNWYSVTRYAAAETRNSTGVAASNGTWVNFRIRRIDSGTIAFSVNGGTEIQHTTNMPTGSLGLAPLMQCYVGSGSQGFSVDYFDLLITGLTR